MPDFSRPTRAADALLHAHATLGRGVGFVAALTGDPRGDLLGDPVRVRMTGNRLRELDRFLGVLAEEAALWLRIDGHDARAFARLHNSANKLAHVRAAMRLATPERAELRAIGRMRACLHVCGGRVLDAATRRDVAAAGGGSADTDAARMVLTLDALQAIGRLYGRVGGGLLTDLERFRSLH